MIYILFAVCILSLFSVYLIRFNLVKENRRKQEISKMEELHLKALLDKHIQTQEFERERIGSDLHDDVSNRLNVLLMKLRMNHPKEFIEKEMSAAIEAVRTLSHNLNPPFLDDVAIEVLLMRQFLKMQPQYRVDVNYYGSFKGCWSANHKIQLLRITQEIISNIIKHSRATTASLTIRESRAGLFLIFNDNGQGFFAGPKGMGFENIENRLFLIQGSFKIKTARHIGTRILIVLKNETHHYC